MTQLGSGMTPPVVPQQPEYKLRIVPGDDTLTESLARQVAELTEHIDQLARYNEQLVAQSTLQAQAAGSMQAQILERLYRTNVRVTQQNDLVALMEEVTVQLAETADEFKKPIVVHESLPPAPPAPSVPKNIKIVSRDADGRIDQVEIT